MKGITSITLDVEIAEWLKTKSNVSKYVNEILRIKYDQETGANVISIDNKISQLLSELQVCEEKRKALIEEFKQQAKAEQVAKIEEIEKIEAERKQSLIDIKTEYDKIPEIKDLDPKIPISELMVKIGEIRTKYPNLKYRLSLVYLRDYWSVV